MELKNYLMFRMNQCDAKRMYNVKKVEPALQPSLEKITVFIGYSTPKAPCYSTVSRLAPRRTT